MSASSQRPLFLICVRRYALIVSWFGGGCYRGGGYEGCYFLGIFEKLLTSVIYCYTLFIEQEEMR